MNLLITFARSPFAAALGWSLMDFLWQGAGIALVAWVSLRIARTARWRYAIACAALFSMPVVFGVTLWLTAPGALAVAGAGRLVPATPSFPAAVPPSGQVARDFSAYVEWVAPAWMAGVVCLLFYRAAAWIFALRLRRRGTCGASAEWIGRVKALSARVGVSRPVALLESALAEVPVMIGYLRPAILVPLGMLAGLAPEQAEAILLHELAHIRRADYLVNVVQGALEALLFYHPSVWWISKVIRAERENCCDDLVLAAQGDPHAYATALLAIERNRSSEMQPALAATDGDLLRRIRRVLRVPQARDASMPVTPAAIMLAALAVGFAHAQAPEMPAVYAKWLTEDVVYIITDVEREGFKKLTNDEDREAFIKDFWLFRDPTPGTPKNEFKEEHYRRIAYANAHFKSPTLAGWKTDRGRIYIVYGPPDEIESHPSAGPYKRPSDQGGGTVNTAPFEQWRYKYIQGIGQNIIIEFVDSAMNGEYRMTTDPHAKEGVKVPLASGRKLSASVSGPGEVTVWIPIDSSGSLDVSGRATNNSGFAVAWFDQPVENAAGTMLVKKMNLAPGSYWVAVTVIETASGKAHTDGVSIQLQ
ncbi:MAG TPA: GWxTD domain-containing protein [Bryobacteraceae bacterium]|nr:GWxTD domain-containing protein [Bryobacteraceae bacterium]